MQRLYARLSVALEAQEGDDVEQLGRQQRHGQVEQTVAEGDRGHQTADGVGGDVGGAGLAADAGATAGKGNGENEKEGF